MRNPALGGLRTTKAQTSLCIKAFVIRLLEGIVSKLATSEVSIFQLVSAAEETGLSLASSDTSKTGFVPTRPINA